MMTKAAYSLKKAGMLPHKTRESRAAPINSAELHDFDQPEDWMLSEERKRVVSWGVIPFDHPDR